VIPRTDYGLIPGTSGASCSTVGASRHKPRRAWPCSPSSRVSTIPSGGTRRSRLTPGPHQSCFKIPISTLKLLGGPHATARGHVRAVIAVSVANVLRQELDRPGENIFILKEHETELKMARRSSSEVDGQAQAGNEN
jgi:hypothetical protein